VYKSAKENSQEIAVVITGDHSCMSTRGIKKSGSSTKTTTFTGIFEENSVLRQKAILLIG